VSIEWIPTILALLIALAVVWLALTPPGLLRRP
jgi:hypothetical protein